MQVKPGVMRTRGESPFGVGMTRLARLTYCGAFAGAINAWLCYADLPVPFDPRVHFEWHLIPAGAIHGGALAAFAFIAANAVSARGLLVRLATAIPVGWLAGYASWMPLNSSVFDDPWIRSLLWPFKDAKWTDTLLGPYCYFGLVSASYYLWLTLRGLKSKALAESLLGACAAGTLGSLWFWVGFEQWSFCLLHGTIWGVLVGLGTGGSRVKPGVA